MSKIEFRKWTIQKRELQQHTQTCHSLYHQLSLQHHYSSPLPSLVRQVLLPEVLKSDTEVCEAVNFSQYELWKVSKALGLRLAKDQPKFIVLLTLDMWSGIDWLTVIVRAHSIIWWWSPRCWEYDKSYNPKIHTESTPDHYWNHGEPSKQRRLQMSCMAGRKNIDSLLI